MLTRVVIVVCTYSIAAWWQVFLGVCTSSWSSVEWWYTRWMHIVSTAWLPWIIFHWQLIKLLGLHCHSFQRRPDWWIFGTTVRREDFLHLAWVIVLRCRIHLKSDFLVWHHNLRRRTEPLLLIASTYQPRLFVLHFSKKVLCCLII